MVPGTVICGVSAAVYVVMLCVSVVASCGF